MGRTPERVKLRQNSRVLAGDPRPSPAELLRDAAAHCDDHDVAWDVYGTGGVIRAFEERVAEMLGYPAARFLPSGTMAQGIAMRLWCDHTGVGTFGMHPTSHLELHEERGYAHLLGLNARLVGPRDRPMLAEHVTSIPEPLGALLTELPIREAGGQLPTWEQLEALKAAAAAAEIPLHLDGARLWCCGAAYDRPLAEITRGFDSCYVSFYKSVGALSGAMLLGPEDFVAQAAVWQRRMGGNLYTLLPNVVTADMRLDAALRSMPERLERARALVAALRDLPGLRAFPDPPHTHVFHVLLDLDRETAYAARDHVAREHGIWLFSGLPDGPAPGTTRFELTVGRHTLALDPQEVRRAFEALLAQALEIAE
ncbi:MAG: beta-1,3-galactosyltransferase [Myxococcales bacterium]|nr:beta-1,3-galactosyltransferase [Myxococcales bacterium]